MSERPNVIFLVWDSCRKDYVKEHAKTLLKLREDNVWFEDAIAPATWSLPSHASIFTGKYPHEHGCNRVGDELMENILCQELKNQGYHTIGVSSNGFANQNGSFHKGFDQFYYTGGEEPYPTALGVYDAVYRDASMEDPPSKSGIAKRLVSDILSNDSPIKSLVNIGAVVCGRATSRLNALQRIPHRVFSSYHGYSYDPEQNTSIIESKLTNFSDSDRPFFLFANYMDAHRPYKGQVDPTGENHFSASELYRLNDEVAAPWKFVEKCQNNEIDPDDIEALRRLYAEEIKTVDQHLNRILDSLEQNGLRDDTLLIVTADHGENLGETDELGRRRFGHEASVSDHLVRVPLLVAHPNLSEQTIKRTVSVKNVFSLLTNSHRFVNRGGETVDELFDDDVVLCEYPAVGGKEIYDQYPNIDRDTLRYRVEEHSVVGFREDWKVLVESTDNSIAWQDGERKCFDAAPTELVETIEASLDSLRRKSDECKDLGQQEIDRLEALGYI